jgi:hypothetical protein
MITIWFTRNTAVSDALLAARDAIDQALFERTAQEQKIELRYDTSDKEIVEVGTSGTYTTDQYRAFFEALDDVGLGGLTVDYETKEEMNTLEAADLNSKFNHVCVS